MERELICQKEGHKMPLDMICLNEKCPNQGVICHHCFITTPHNHMSSDFLQFNKFITESHKAFEEYSNEISSHTNAPLETAREEYGLGRRMIESCKERIHGVLSQYFQDIENNLNMHYKSFENNVEGPKLRTISEMDKYKGVLRSLQNGEIQDQNQISKEVLELWRAFQPNESNQFALKAEFMSKGNEAMQKEESLRLFREANKNARSCLDKVDEWLKIKPTLEECKTKKGYQSHLQRSQLPPSNMVTRGKSSVGKTTVSKIPNAFAPSNTSKKHEPSAEAEDIMRLSGSFSTKKLKVEGKDYGRPVVKQTPLKAGKSSCTRPHEDIKFDGFKDLVNEKLASSVIVGKPAAARKPFQSATVRFILDIGGQEKFLPGDVTALTFSTDRELNLIGFGQYMIARGATSGTFEYVLLQGDSVDEDGKNIQGKSNVQTRGTIRLTRAEKDPRSTQVFFDGPVKIAKGRFYTIKLTNKCRDQEICLWRGTSGNEKKGPFSFFNSKSSENQHVKNNVKKGQFPELYFTT